MVGRAGKVLIETRGRREGQLIGKAAYLHAVHAVAPDDLIGQVIPVRIPKEMTNSLTGQVLSAPARPHA
jgi:tRNA-2-methylthio-N6-dimethylallyladenosine synthase